MEGFHVNIVSQALLRKSGIWVDGYDNSLYTGDHKAPTLLSKLETRHNLLILEYKPLLSCSIVPSSFALLHSGDRPYRKHFRRSRDEALPRSDSEELWHLRAGHLGPAALRALVRNARNVEIKGIARINCEYCARAYATQVISRTPSERSSKRPFWRVLWDLFDYHTGYDGSNWLLVVKDEYSGKLYGFLLKNKSHASVSGTIQAFDAHVTRHYGLSICFLKHDNDTSVIPINPKAISGYQRWTTARGIELERPPTHTHEPTGGIERAGRSIQPRSIAMLTGANLPEKLWPESTLTAIYLHNISPSQKHHWRTPNEVLSSWFRQYFRWYEPQYVESLTADLRPSWSGIYAYGARAYPLVKDREAGRNVRAFKTAPRASIGYLVGYVSQNIFRIWIPELDRVIVTRNVTFDEHTKYAPHAELAPGDLTTLSYLADSLEISGVANVEIEAIKASVVDQTPEAQDQETTDAVSSGVVGYEVVEAHQNLIGLLTPEDYTGTARRKESRSRDS